MNTTLNKELVLQFSIILACLNILFLQFPAESPQAQNLCYDEPPLLDPAHPLRRAWYHGVTVSTKVYETPDINNVNTIRDGFQVWNSSQNCSNVTFGDVSQVNGDYDENQLIPDNTISEKKETVFSLWLNTINRIKAETRTEKYRRQIRFSAA